MGVIGLDLGFRQVKLTTEEGDIKFDSVMGYPSVIELSEEDTEKGATPDNIAILHENTMYYIGERAIKKTNNAQLDFSADKTNNKSDLLKTLAAIGLAMGDKEKESFKIVSGLPVDEMGLKTQMAQNLEGNYRFILNGHEKSVEVEDVRIIAQSAGAYYDYILDMNGNILEDRIHPKVLVIDEGFRTTDVVTMEDAKFKPMESFTIYTGVNSVHLELRKLILANYGIRKELEEMDKIMRDRYVVVSGKPVVIDKEIEKAVRPYAEKIISELPSRIPNLQEANMIILAGGGMNIMGQYFTGLPAPTHIVEDAEQANSRGYYKYMKLLLNNK